MNRRDFLQRAAALAALPILPAALAQSASTATAGGSLHELSSYTDQNLWRKLLQPPAKSIAALAQDESYWQQVRQFYQLPAEVIQLENGNWGVMSKPVLADYLQQTQRVNQDSSYYSRRQFGSEFKPILAAVAARLGCAASELAFARGASEVLNQLITGYRPLQGHGKKVAVMYADVDYDSMQAALHTLGTEVIKIDLPEQASASDYVEIYRRALQRHPQVKLLLLTHLSHRHGLVLPIKEIVAMARTFGVDCIVDAAHSWGQMNFDLNDLGADFVGFNLHKWMGAPLGVGVMYIKSTRLADIAPASGDNVWLQEQAASHNDRGFTYQRIHTGTFNYAAWLSVPTALAYRDAIGAELIAARLRYLRHYWTSQVGSHVQVIGSQHVDNFAGIGAFRLNGQTSLAANQQLASTLLQQHRIFSVHRNGLAAGACLRITPALFTSTAELDTLLHALT